MIQTAYPSSLRKVRSVADFPIPLPTREQEQPEHEKSTLVHLDKRDLSIVLRIASEALSKADFREEVYLNEIVTMGYIYSLQERVNENLGYLESKVSGFTYPGTRSPNSAN